MIKAQVKQHIKKPIWENLHQWNKVDITESGMNGLSSKSTTCMYHHEMFNIDCTEHDHGGGGGGAGVLMGSKCGTEQMVSDTDNIHTSKKITMFKIFNKDDIVDSLLSFF